MTTDLRSFKTQLAQHMSDDSHVRPFVCEGSPLACRIVIAGFNPATSLEGSFWDFWDDQYGFHKAAWLEQYRLTRRQQPLRPGKTRRSELSNTRRVLEWIVAAAAPQSCLETNLYALPTPQARDLQQADRQTAVFDFLIQAVQPTVLLLHGRDAVHHMEQRCQTTLPLDRCIACRLEGRIIQVLGVPHLSRGWSRARAEGLGARLREVVQPSEV